MESQNKEATEIQTTQDENEMTFNEDFFDAKSGVKIYRWRLVPKMAKPKSLLFICHGYGEYSRRHMYDEFARLVCFKLGCLVLSHDHIGHGKSGGERVMVDSFDMFVEDVFEHIDQVKKEYPDVPVYLFGHSMGGTISILAACKRPKYFKGIVLSSPGIKPNPDMAPGAFKICLMGVTNRFFPSMEIVPAFDASAISSDPDQVKAYQNDPLIWHGGMKLRFAKCFYDATSLIHDQIPFIEWPFLVIHGDCDKMVNIDGSKFLEKEARSRDKEIKIYKGLRHEMLNEVKDHAEQVREDILEWFQKQVAA